MILNWRLQLMLYFKWWIKAYPFYCMMPRHTNSITSDINQNQNNFCGMICSCSRCLIWMCSTGSLNTFCWRFPPKSWIPDDNYATFWIEPTDYSGPAAMSKLLLRGFSSCNYLKSQSIPKALKRKIINKT